MEVYLDNSATTKCYECVRDLVGKIMCDDYGNPSSMHKKGVDAEKYVRESKETLAKLLKVQEKELVFTSGGTESDNLALIGCARANKRAGNHLITSSIEHPAILQTMQDLEKHGLTLSHADLNPGNILLDENHNVCGILDFAFVSYTSDLNDMARLIGRLPSDYYDIMLEEYNKRFKLKYSFFR
mgnify:CR=1 FL=1